MSFDSAETRYHFDLYGGTCLVLSAVSFSSRDQPYRWVGATQVKQGPSSNVSAMKSLTVGHCVPVKAHAPRVSVE
ncbi:MAG: hypothetical protein ABSF15_24770 [Candidatus Sulfotelmatobacter sp.]|jgi:hypothetical protein